jgi:hypothetical protein
VFAIGPLTLDFIAEELSRLMGSMCDQSLFFGERQAQFLRCELSDPDFDFFGFGFRPHEAQQEVVGVSNVSESAVVWVVWDKRWYLL